MKEIELLAPAKNLESGKAAINYGADAVYIGAPLFGARAAASNSVTDIELLVQYAHRYKAKVFVALNTILYDNELDHAERLIYEIFHAGVDALIVQDMGILKMNIPPISLHASTQTHNYSPERIVFLDSLGFDRIVLARELTHEEIKQVRSLTKTELEFFIHGALCVSFSGQCYFSQAITGRSANRGVCAQMCRHPYHLVDGKGEKIKVNSHLLSLKDLNLSSQLGDLIRAGITSLKIEGRLKDINYVKNVVSYYRQQLDLFFNSEPGYMKASSGKTTIGFTPDPERSFNRQSTAYFLNGRIKGLVNHQSPKSTGKKVGRIDQMGSGYFTMKKEEDLHNGDGLCFMINNELKGVRVEKVVDDKVYVNDLSNLTSGTLLYRNYDHEFIRMLESDQSIRKVTARILIKNHENTLEIEMTDEDQLSSHYTVDPLPEPAKNSAMARANLIAQFSKSGASMFEISEVKVMSTSDYFFRISELNEIRRTLFEKHEKLRIESYKRKEAAPKKGAGIYPEKELDFSANISNVKAAQFYSDYGVARQAKALEISTPENNQLLMTTRYCLKFELGYCEKFQDIKTRIAEPLYLEDQNRKYLLQFDCKNCLMKIRTADSPQTQ